MITRKRIQIYLCLVSCAFALFLSSAKASTEGYSITQESVTSHQVKSTNPFVLPQTSFFMGSTQTIDHISRGEKQNELNLNAGGINTYGAEMEVNHSRNINIGANLTFESSENLPPPGGKSNQNRLTFLVGGFARFFYLPSFLKGADWSANLFSRLDLKAGPTIMYDIENPSGYLGLIAQPGIHLGSEVYFNRWFGIGLSYGQIYGFGRETQSYGSSPKGTIFSRGHVFQVSLKTTYF